MRPARVSTIVWGVLLLLLAGAAFAVTALDVEVFSGASVAYIVVGLGALLVLAAIVGGIAQLTRRAERVEPVETAEPVEPVETPSPKVSTRSTRTKDQPVD